ncbi:MAG: ATP-binding cassette domain-containing protein [Acidobacteria bacterium]|nr:ATP-binding cassette domain-containing protein [Acidobacteriota bacterium]
MEAETPSRWRAFFFAWQYLKPYKKAIGIALAALVFTAMVTLSLGQGVRLLIDRGFATESMDQLNRYVLLFLGLVVALAIGTFTRFYWVSWLGERVVADIRQSVFNHLIDLHPGFFESNRGLEIQSRITTDTTLLQSVIGSSLSVALRQIVMSIGGVIWLFITNAKLTLIVVLSVPVVVAPILIFGRRVRKLSRDSQDKVADVGAYVGEVLGQIKTVQAYNHQVHDKRIFGEFVEMAFSVAKKRIVQRGALITVVIVFVLGAMGLMLWVGGGDVIRGEISGGELAAFVFYSMIVGSAFGSISEVIGELQRAAGAAERMVELLAAKNEIQAPIREVEHLPTPISGHLVLENVVYAYPSRPDQPAIQHLSLEVVPGETLALVGPSGAGKSTLFDLLLRFADVDQGQIRLEGHDIRQLDPLELRKCFSLVSQNPSLFFGSIEQNLKYGKPDASQAEMEQAARAAHAHEFINELPNGYQTRLGDLGLGLSGGQKQRLAIARALLANAPILLLDEATSALDAQSEFLVQQALENLMAGRTTLVIAHRLATVKNADRIAVLNQGRLEGLGTHRELVETNALYARLAKLQFDLAGIAN